MTPELYLGVDGGQSSTKAVVGDAAGRILGQGIGGPCNHAAKGEGRAKLIRGLTESVGEALRPVGLTLDTASFRRACIGMSGGPDDKAAIIREVIRSDFYDLCTDAAIALYGAVGGKPGAIVIAGTGSMALARDAQGRTWRSGGWGYVFGDEGSAFDIARNALRAVLRREEADEPDTPLRSALLAAGESETANELLHRWYAGAFERDQTAAWAPLVSEAAAQADPDAPGILAQAGRELAELASDAAQKANLTPGSATICALGGVFESPIVREIFQDALRESFGVSPAAAAAGAAEGALLAASHGADLGTPNA